MRRELLTAIEIGGIVAIGLGALSAKQRDWVIARDKKCKAPFKHQEDREHPLEVHHIVGQRTAAVVGIKNPDIPQNVITLCRTGHDVIHPDRVEARKRYHQDKAQGIDSFKEMFSERDKKLANRQIAHNDQYDRQMVTVVMKQNETVDVSTFPEVKHRKKK